MNKKEIFTFRGINQDVTKSKHPKEFYYEGNNIRISSTDSQSTGSITNEKGTEISLSIPAPTIDFNTSNINYGTSQLKFKTKELDVLQGETSGTQVIIGHTIARDNIIIFSTDSNGFDCVWELVEDNETFKLTLLYLRSIGFNKEKPIQSIFNFENDNIQKVYWVDGENQLRFLNTKHKKATENKEALIDVAANTINVVGNFNISQPKITEIVSGGTHTAGMIQYAYNLYRLNSSQTKLSPLSPLVPLDKGKGQGGGEVNEIVGSTPIVEMSDLDPEYTHIKVYAVKYTSYNQSPSVSLIKDQEIGSTRAVTVFDDGNVINDLSLSEFLFLGSDPIIPKHIEVKDNILFPSNIKEQHFDVDIDTRAYSFDNVSTATIYNDIKVKDIEEGQPSIPSIIQMPINIDKEGNRFFDDGLSTSHPTESNPVVRQVVTGAAFKVDPSTFTVPLKHDAINIDYNRFKYQADGVTYGGEGKYIKYEIVGNNTIHNPDTYKFFKDNEIYRLGITFYNRLGQKSLPKWIADFRAPEGNLKGEYNTLKLTLKPEFFVWLNTSSNFESEDDKPVGYRVLRANRTQNDRSIITQGFLNGMMSNFRDGGSKSDGSFNDQGRYRCQEGNKLPSLQRVYGKHHTQMEGMLHNLKLDNVNTNDDMREVHKASSSDNWIAETFQYNIIMQMFSPEVMFSNVSLYEGLQLRVKGALKAKEAKFWGQARNTNTKDIMHDGKVLHGLTPHEDIQYSNTGETRVSGNIDAMADLGIFGPASPRDDHTEMDFYQFYRNFTGDYYEANGKKYPVYGKPEIAERGQGGRFYNNDANFKYYNSLQPMLADGGDGSGENSPAITSVNSWGAKNLTFVLGPDDRDIVTSRPKLENLWSQSGIAESNVMLIAEFVKDDRQIYLGGMYGGNTYEDKKRTNYIEIGSYVDIAIDSITINSPGDTFVGKFRFGKLLKTDTEVYSPSSMQISEIVEGYIESSVDLKNRNDISLTGWDSRFQPRYDEYHKYNRVYSQEPTLILNQDVDYNFRKIKNFDSRIMASKIKVPGEFIDNWTDFLVNEVQDLNGKYGPINALTSFKDNIYAIQDKALAYVAVNPRVQVQGSDGIAVELGKGNILHDYKYVTTDSGTLNKWSVIPTQHAIYYFDNINKSFNRFSNKLERLSEMHGLHSWFQNEVEYDTIKLDNPIIGTGAHVGYDLINNSIMLTLKQNNSKTLIFNEATNSFVSFMDYFPSRYISNNGRLYSILDNDNTIHEHFKGEYNSFYGQYKPSYITLLVNPNSNAECVFNNIEFNSELYLNDIDQSNQTLTHIHAWNEYQDSGKIPLVIGRNSNLRRKFRTWRANIPRDGRNRIRNPWIYLKLELDNTNNYKLILHDIIVSYTLQ
jgi:hypothetical protein